MKFRQSVLATAILLAQQAHAQIDIDATTFLQDPSQEVAREPDASIEEIIVSARYIPDEKRST
ncbi:MAG: hypothetical protein FD165_2894, partial [Gammaproteobacteria bacterium]